MSQNLNPFTYGRMISDPERFIGRRAELNRIIARLTGTQCEGVSIVGQRRIGKSSLLRYLEKPRQDDRARLGQNLLVVYFSAAEGTCDTPESFRASLMLALIEKAKLVRPSLPREMRRIEKQLQRANSCSWSTPKTVLKQFEYIQLQPVVCLDEFERLLCDAFPDAFFTALRNWSNEGLLIWITASSKPLNTLETLYGRSSPFFNLLGSMRLRDLTDHEADELLAQANRTAYPFSEKEKRMLRDLGGNNPYHLQIVARRSWQSKKDGKRLDEKTLRDDLCYQANPPASCDDRNDPPKPKETHRWMGWMVTTIILIIIIIVLIGVIIYLKPELFHKYACVLYDHTKNIHDFLIWFGAVGTGVSMIWGSWHFIIKRFKKMD